MYRSSLALVALTLPLGACSVFDKAKNTYEGLTNPIVTEAFVLGIEAPDDPRIDLSGTDYDDGTGATVFLADAESADDIENAPVEGADVSIRPDAQTNVTADDQGGGLYTIEPGGDLAYAEGATWTIATAVGDDVGKATVQLPPPAQFDIAEQHGAGQPVTLDFTGMDFNSAFVVVLDGTTGDVTYSNQPQDVKDVYDMTHGSDTVGVFTVPGSAFPEQKVYALGVAGMKNTTMSSFDGMNTALSAVLAGKMKVYPIVTAQTP